MRIPPRFGYIKHFWTTKIYHCCLSLLDPRLISHAHMLLVSNVFANQLIILLKRLGACEQLCPNTCIETFKGKNKTQLGMHCLYINPKYKLEVI